MATEKLSVIEFADCPLQLSEWKKMLVRRNDDED